MTDCCICAAVAPSSTVIAGSAGTYMSVVNGPSADIAPSVIMAMVDMGFMFASAYDKFEYGNDLVSIL
jgi:hypothetical protein